MNREQLIQILQREINKDKLSNNSKIWEFHKEANKSMGVSYDQNENGDFVYIFNVFNDDDYVEVPGEYKDLIDGVDALLKVWNSISSFSYKHDRKGKGRI